MNSWSPPMSQNTCGWSNGGVAPMHMNSLAPISITATPGSLWKCGSTCSAIGLFRKGCWIRRHLSEPGRGFLERGEIAQPPQAEALVAIGAGHLAAVLVDQRLGRGPAERLPREVQRAPVAIL